MTHSSSTTPPTGGTIGPVDGEATGEVMGLGYDDSNAPTDQGGDVITDNADLINGGDDTIDGAGGDDTIYGDGGSASARTHEIFQWDEAPGFANNATAGGFTQDTGNANVTFSIDSATSDVTNEYETNTQNTDDLDAAVDENASFESVLNGDSNSATYSWSSDTELENVEFRVNDIDGDGRIYVRAFDADGNETIVELSNAGSHLDLSDTDGVAGDDTASHHDDDDYDDDSDPDHSVLVTIPGPVVSWELVHEQDGNANTGINVTDITYDVPAPVVIPGDDVIEGNTGDDLIFGQAGDDTITGGDGADTMSGGDDRDTFIGGTDGDEIDGGTDGNDFDTLDLRGLGPIEIVGQTTDADGDSTSGTIQFLNTGETIEFSEIEEILHDPDLPGPVDGLNTGEDMGPGYTDLQGDQIDGTDGDDDTILGNGGDDTIDSGAGDDTVDGGSGDDVFAINDEGDGIDNDVITGGETGETDGDTLDSSGVGDNLTLDITAPEEGTLTDGVDTTEFEEIEQFVLGYGDDTVSGSDGDDNVDAGGGHNVMDGGDGDDSLSSARGNDTITGGDGSDTVNGGSGDNVIDTSGGSPRPDLGYPGVFSADADPDDDRDLVITTFGNDSITTGDDADTISSGAGNDTIDSGWDADEIEAGGGDDLITSGEGADNVDGGSGNDTIYGGLGPSAPDVLNITDEDTGGFSPDLVPANGMDTLDGGIGHDVIYGEDDDDLIIGGGGADTLDGGIDDDTILGGTGQDDIIGGQGADSMSGGDDRDFFFIDDREDGFGDTIDGGTGGNDVDTLDLRGLGPFEVVGETTDADGDSTSGTVNFLAGDGTVEGTLEFGEIERLIICFTPGSRIATPRGEINVQDLKAGDRVITRDDGVQEIHWIGRKKLTAADLIDDPKLRPVLIRKGALGNNLPERDMMVSPNHRMLMANSQTQVLFDEREVLVAAKHLVGQPGVHQVDTLGTEYVHVMFERHEVILGDGAWTESFQPGDHSLSGIDSEQRDEIFKLFPDLQGAEGRRSYASARQSLKAHEARMLRQSMGVN